MGCSGAPQHLQNGKTERKRNHQGHGETKKSMPCWKPRDVGDSKKRQMRQAE